MSSGSKITPIPVYSQNLNIINMIFNTTLKVNQMDATNFSPTYKLGFLGNGQHYLDRMFTVEERNGMLFFVRNVQFGDEQNSYKRSVYTIPQNKTLYVHYTTGTLFKDLFDYAHLESSEVSNNVIFQYDNQFYNTINEISEKDPNDYKTKTRIFIKSTQNEIYNNMYIYGTYIDFQSQNKVGYYIPESSIEYYHTIYFLGKLFGVVDNNYKYQFFSDLSSNPNNIYNVINQVFTDPRQIGGQILNKNGMPKKQPKKNPYMGVSLMNKLASEINLQFKRFTIGWFLCEIMYPLFFADAW